MKKLLTLSLTLFLVSNLLSQDLPIQSRNIKTGVDQESILEDSVFTKALNEVKLNVKLYSIVNIYDIVSYRDSLIISKLSHTTLSYDIFYKTLDEFTFNSSKNKVINNQKKLTGKNTKLLFCYRTLTPDEKGKYKVYFYIVE